MAAPKSEEVEVEDPMDKASKELYFKAEDPGSYGGVEKLFRSAKNAKVVNGVSMQKVTRGRVKQFLADQQSYSLHKPARRDFKRNPTYVKGIDAQWQADLADMQALSRDNKGHKFIMTVIDIFNKGAWAITIKNKDRKSVV